MVEEMESSIKHVMETNMDSQTEKQLAELLETCFPGTFDGRTYFKQLPHSRLIYYRGGQIIGQLGMDFRVIRVGDRVIRTLGIIDVCVTPPLRLQNCASEMLNRAAIIAKCSRTDFQILFADNSKLYENNDFQFVNPAIVSWVAIEERKTYGLIERDMTGTLMMRSTKNTYFPQGQIDLLGYLF